jgi:hypothetical protein
MDNTIRAMKARKDFRGLLASRSAESDAKGFHECRFQCDRHEELGTANPIAKIAANRVLARIESERKGWFEMRDFFTAEDRAETLRDFYMGAY